MKQWQRLKQMLCGMFKLDCSGIRTHIGLHLGVLVVTMLLGVILALFFTNNLTSNAKSLASVLIKDHRDVYEDVSTHFGVISAETIALSKSLSSDIGYNLQETGLTFSELQKRPALLPDILDQETDLLLLTLERANCSGVFVVLDATVNPLLPGAANSRTGIYIQRVEPKRIGNPSEILYLRGFIENALRRNMTLQASWDLEFDITGREFWSRPLEAVKDSSVKPLSFYSLWLFESVIPSYKNDSLLCCIPIFDLQGNAMGVCGLEITEVNFRSLYPVLTSPYSGIASAFTAVEDDRLDLSVGLFAGAASVGKTLSNTAAINISDNNKIGLERFQADGAEFRGIHKEVQLYANDAYFNNNRFALTYLVPESIYKREIYTDILRLLAIIAGMLVIGFALTSFLSKMVAVPVYSALEHLKNPDQIDPGTTFTVGIKEIDELLRIVTDKTPGHIVTVGDIFSDFIEKIASLTPTERAIVAHYANGLSFEEAREQMFIAAGTLKTHNVHIYRKLEIKGIDELRLYINLISQTEAIEQLKLALKMEKGQG